MNDPFWASRDSRRGILLPVVLLLILGIGAASISVGVLVGTQQFVGRGELRHLEQGLRAQAVLAGPPAPPASGGFTRIERSLPEGFALVEAAPVGGGPSYFSLEWVLNPDSIAAGFPGALALAGSPPDGGVRALDGCVSVTGRPLVLAIPVGGGPGVGPGGPRVGILRVQELLELAEVELSEPWILPAEAPAAVRRAPSGAVIRGGAGSGVLVSGGDLTLAGATYLVGLIVAAGDLILTESARFEGVALVGGTVDIAEGASVLGCPTVARDALGLPMLARAHPLPDGWFLGRF